VEDVGRPVGVDRTAAGAQGVSFRHSHRKRPLGWLMLCGIALVLHTQTQWAFLARELGFPSGLKWGRRSHWPPVASFRSLSWTVAERWLVEWPFDVLFALLDRPQVGYR